jgi:hypothetical protein
MHAYFVAAATVEMHRAAQGPPEPGLPISEIIDVNVGPEPDVVGKIPTIMVWIFVNDDLVGVPEPIVAETDVSRSHTESEIAKNKARGAALP